MFIKRFGFYLIVDFESRYFRLILAAGAAKDFATVPEKSGIVRMKALAKHFKSNQ